ncbi:MAG: sodC [Gammaproteobacteria bacterium]|jgi:Cu-Zn family superoxide dismutase|nr:sodC [Gammaproteobacteria bacterium]
MINMRYVLVLWLGLGMSLACASIQIPMYLVKGNQSGQKIGVIRADDTIYGVLLTPRLHHLLPGVHGFHVHEFPFCQHHAQGAGGHLDPEKTNQHSGPYRGNGHLGDLPVLIVDRKGEATLPILAPRLKLSQIEGHALMIHVGEDNYSDIPEKLGGGGAKLACGSIPYH